MKKPVKYGLIGCGGVFGLLVICGIIGALMNPTTTTTTASSAPSSAAIAIADVPSAEPSAAAPPAASVEPTAEPTSEPTAEPTPAPAAVGAIGERREAGDIALTVVSVEKVASISDFQKAEAGKTYLLAEVVIENINRDTAPYNPLYFKAKDADGFEYTGTINTGDQALKSGELGKGEKVRGKIAVEVPEAARTLILSYEPLVLLGGYEPIRIQVTE